MRRDDTQLNIAGMNWPVLINVEQVCRVMVDLRNNIELGLRSYSIASKRSIAE